MNLVRASWGKVRALLARLWGWLRTGFALLGRVLAPAVGRISWTRPEWPARLNRRRKTLGKKFYIGLYSVLGVLVLALIGLAVYRSLPQPALTTVSIDMPDITPAREPLEPQALTVHFSLDNPFAAKSNAAARLDLIGKPVPTGITMKPAAAGE